MSAPHSFANVLPNVRDYTPHEPGLYRQGMGLRVLEPAAWIEIDQQMPHELAERRHLLAERHAEVFAALPEASSGARESLDILVDHLIVHFPWLYGREGNNVHQHITGEVWDLESLQKHPLEVAGRLVQEDLCLMGYDADSQSFRLTAACLCFPTRWRLAEKMGCSMDGIHVPVPEYAEDLGPGVNRLFDRLKVERPVWRLNWSVLDDPALFQPGEPGSNTNTHIEVADIGERLWLRVERQTLRRLPTSKDILFTIRVYNYALSCLEPYRARASRLAAAVRALGEDMQTYKSMRPYLTPLLTWLDTVAESSAESVEAF